MSIFIFFKIIIILLQSILNFILLGTIQDSMEEGFEYYCICFTTNVIALIFIIVERILPEGIIPAELLTPHYCLIGSIIFSLIHFVCIVISGIERYQDKQIKRNCDLIQQICDYIENIIDKCSATQDSEYTIRLSLSEKALIVLNQWTELFKANILKTDSKTAKMLELTSNLLDTYFELCEKDDSENNIISFEAGMQCVKAIINLENCVRAYLKQEKEQNEKEIADLMNSLSAILEEQLKIAEEATKKFAESEIPT